MKDTLQVTLLKLNELQAEVDSLKYSSQIDKMQFRVDRELEIVQQVNEYYTSSFQMLALAFTIVGVLIPIGIQWYQQSRIKALNTKIVNDITNTFDKKIKALDQQFAKKSEEIKSMDSITKLRQGATIYFAQGHTYVYQEDWEYALYNLIRAASNWYETNDEEEFEFILMVISSFVEKTTKKDLDEVNDKLARVGLNMTVDEIIERFREKEQPKEVEELLEKIIKQFKSLQ